jgi:hypothetical protein
MQLPLFFSLAISLAETTHIHSYREQYVCIFVGFAG